MQIVENSKNAAEQTRSCFYQGHFIFTVVFHSGLRHKAAKTEGLLKAVKGVTNQLLSQSVF